MNTKANTAARLAQLETNQLIIVLFVVTLGICLMLLGLYVIRLQREMKRLRHAPARQVRVPTATEPQDEPLPLADAAPPHERTAEASELDIFKLCGELAAVFEGNPEFVAEEAHSEATFEVKTSLLSFWDITSQRTNDNPGGWASDNLAQVARRLCLDDSAWRKAVLHAIAQVRDKLADEIVFATFLTELRIAAGFDDQ